jgi:uncharacterized BrkB/YihY/UPF0761 family membrane protein
MYTLGYVGKNDENNNTMYSGADEVETAAIRKLTAALGTQLDVVNQSVVLAINGLLGTTYTATEIVRNIEKITADVIAAKPAEKGAPKWLWALMIGLGVVGVAAVGVTFYVRSKKA